MTDTTKTQPIVLTGFMGTGKTTVGRLVANALGFTFVDTDALIELRHGPIETIFAEQGEDAFREMEREVARELASVEAVVVSTGGRFMLDPANVEALAASAVFCLHAPADEIVRRVRADAERVERPLLAGPDPAARVVALLREREAAYRAFPQVATADRSPEAIASEIVSRYMSS